MTFLQAFRRFGSFLATALTLPMLGGLPPALAGEHYRLEIDGFNDTKMWAGYISYEKECYTEGSKLDICQFVHSTESLASPTISMVITSWDKDWQLLDHIKDETNTIITYMDGSVIRKTLPITVDGGVPPGTEVVVESVKLSLRPMQDELENISQIEVQVGPHEYLWKPDPVLTKKALNFEEP